MYRKLAVTEMGRKTVEEFKQADKTPLVVVLDNVRSQHNVGAVFRTADAFLLQGICLCGICCCPPNQEIHKTALGAELTVDWKHFDNTLDAVAELQQKGYKVYAIEQAENSTMLDDFLSSLTESDSVGAANRQKLAIVMGHEVYGVQQQVVDACDGCIEIPQYGTKHSLNVSVTAGIVIYSIATRIRKLLGY